MALGAGGWVSQGWLGIASTTALLPRRVKNTLRESNVVAKNIYTTFRWLLNGFASKPRSCHRLHQRPCNLFSTPIKTPLNETCFWLPNPAIQDPRNIILLW